MLAALFAWQGQSFWESSEGVYAYTARALLDGSSPYGEVAAAHPPPLFWTGAAALAVADSIWMLRGLLGLVAQLGGGLVALSVWRLTRNGPATVIAGLASLITPWAIREHAILIPESFAAPLLMAAALLAAGRPKWSAAAGAVAAVATSFKLAFALPLIAIGVVAADRRRYAVGAALTLVVLGGLFLAIFGRPLVDNVLVAQAQTGTVRLDDVVGLWAQAAWNALPLLALAAVAWGLRHRALDDALLRTLTALLVSAILLLGTLLKTGAYLNVLVILEPPAVALGAAGLTWLFAELRARLDARARLARIAAVATVTLVLAQSVSLLVSPADPEVFVRPFSRPAHARTLSSDEVEQRAATARSCPDGVPFSGPAYIAFLADRRMPGNQPDQFIVSNAAVHAELARKARRDRPRCP
jgi:hypothetical protein